MKLFLDTNVVVDYFAKQGKIGKDAELLMVIAAFGDVSLWMSGRSFTDTYYILKKYTNPQNLQKTFRASLEDFNVLASPDADDIKTACEWQWPDFEDALIAISAEKVKADYIITRDKDFSASKIPTLTPDELLQKMRDEQRLTYAIIDTEDVLAGDLDA